MPHESREPVRQPVAVRAASERRLAERFALRFPHAAASLLGLLLRLPPASRLRRSALRHFLRQGVEALNRGDFEAVFWLWHRDCEFVPSAVGALGLEGTSGRAERIRFQERWVADWGGFRFEPEELIDLGDDRRFMWVGRTTGSGLTSGASVDSECAVLLTVDDGWVVREEVYLDRAHALAAAGLTA